MKLEIDSERVVALSKKCPQWKYGLKELFPKAFEGEGELSASDFLFTKGHDYSNCVAITMKMPRGEKRHAGWMDRKGFG